LNIVTFYLQTSITIKQNSSYSKLLHWAHLVSGINSLYSSFHQPHSSLTVSVLPALAAITSFHSCQLTTLTVHNSLSLPLPPQNLPLSEIFSSLRSCTDFMAGPFIWNISVHVRYMVSPIRLSVLCLSSVTLVHLTLYRLKFWQFFCVIWYLGHPLKTLRRTFRGTPLSRGLNARGVATYSDFGPIEGYISETCKVGGKLVLIPNRKFSIGTKIGDLE